jgi:DNA-directed RNA polymerase specialized sigma24 family protein
MSTQPSEQAAPAWQVSVPLPRQAGATKRGKDFRDELFVKMAVRGTRSASPEWLKVVSGALQRTLQHLIGPDVPIEPLLESALFEALSTWPPAPGDGPVSVWLQRIAAGVALAHLRCVSPGTEASGPGARPGGILEVLSNLHARLRAFRAEEQVAFALLDLDGRSLSEAAMVLRVPVDVVRGRARRVRQHLLFAARGDRLVIRYLCMSARLRALARRLDRRLLAFSLEAQRPIPPTLTAELQWFM